MNQEQNTISNEVLQILAVLNGFSFQKSLDVLDEVREILQESSESKPINTEPLISELIKFNGVS